MSTQNTEWQLVPRVPTPEMTAAAAATPGMKAIDGAASIHQLRGYPLPAEAFLDGSPLEQAWAAMLAAAHSAPKPVAFVSAKDLEALRSGNWAFATACAFPTPGDTPLYTHPLPDQEAMRGALEALEEFGHRLTQWAGAYPVTAFPEVEDWSAVDAALAAHGLSLTRVSAANMRHVVTTLNNEFAKVRTAIASLEAAVKEKS